MGNFHTDVILKDVRANSLAPIHDVALLEPGTRAAVAQLQSLAMQAGHVLHIGETYRSQALQHLDYTKRLTQISHVGCHGYGVAADLTLLVNGKYDPIGEHYEFFIALCKRCKLVSGIDWGQPKKPTSFHDWDHVQRVPVFRQKALFAGTWYPPIDYDPYADMVANGIVL